MHVAIAGNIGSGKTTLAEMLAKHYAWEVMYEETDNNPYLNDFYNDMQRWSFNLQIYFLNQRLKQLAQIRNGDKIVVQDRTIYEDAYIFAPNLQAMGLMTTKDYETYVKHFELLDDLIAAPDLLIYLKASVPTLVSHIQDRGREYEESIRLDYLRKLNERYDDWISQYNKGKVVVVNVDENNFPKSQEDLGKIIQMIDGEINGLF